jgi:undecaprenyl diphosphate synthase
VAIIMDGNRRWAKVKGLGAVAGHAFAVDSVVEQLIERAGELGIENLTMWAFSTENWGREEDEVTGIMNLFRKALMTKVGKMIQKGARLKMIGDISKFAPDIQEGMKQAMAESEKNTKITVTFALNYGGRDEIVRAVNKWAKDTLGSDPVSLRSTKQPANGGLSLAGQTPRVAERELEDYLDTAGMSDPDLIMRTGGE